MNSVFFAPQPDFGKGLTDAPPTCQAYKNGVHLRLKGNLPYLYPTGSDMVRLLFLLTVCLASLAAGCRQSGQTDTASGVVITLADSPTTRHVVGPGALTIRLATADGAPIADATVELRGDMAHAGMTPSLGTATAAATPGDYDATIEWTMAGDWIVTVTATLPDGGVATEEFTLRVAVD